MSKKPIRIKPTNPVIVELARNKKYRPSMVKNKKGKGSYDRKKSYEPFSIDDDLLLC